jgi:hypothetical protein
MCGNILTHIGVHHTAPHNEYFDLQCLLPCPLLPKTNNLTHTTSHPMMIKVITPLNDPNKQSASCHPKGLPALLFMPSAM